MAYKKTYTAEELHVFWKRDFMMELQNIRNYIGRLYETNGLTKEEADKLVLEELLKNYPEGFDSKCKNSGRMICYAPTPTTKRDDKPF